MNNTFSSSTIAPPIPAIHNFPSVPSYVVALCVVTGVVGTVLVLRVLYYCLVEKSKRRQKVIVDTHDRETEQLREEAVVDCGSLGDAVLLTRQTTYLKPQPSPSIFSRGDFSTPILALGDSSGSAWDRSAALLCVRQESYQEKASTAALRGSLSSEQGVSGSKGDVGCGEVEIYEVTMDNVEVFEDSVNTKKVEKDTDNFKIYEDTKNNTDNETKNKDDDVEVKAMEISVHLSTAVSNCETDLSFPHNTVTSSVPALSQSNPSIPVNIIPTSDQKVPLLNSHSTPTTSTSLLRPQVSMLALPLTERAVSVSRLSLNTPAGTGTLPDTPLSVSCDYTKSGYSPVYSMQFGSGRRLAVDSGDLNCARVECSEEDGQDVTGDGGEANYPLEVEVVVQDDPADLSPE